MTVVTPPTPRRDEAAEHFLRSLRRPTWQRPAVDALTLADDFDPTDPGTILSLALRALRTRRTTTGSHTP